jgi:murein DD-endopeptidase MepM/ murein hydrolase activator NlpD
MGGTIFSCPVAMKAQVLFTRCKTGTKASPAKRGSRPGDLPLSLNVLNRLNSSLERLLPEQRLFLRSDDTTRFVRLRPLTQLVGISGITLVCGWTLVASSILVIDAINSGSSRDQAMRTEAAFEERLEQLSTERDSRAAEAVAAQNRFSVALEQVSKMQSQLLTSEEKRRELETGLQAVQTTLRDAINQRDEAQRLAGDSGADANDHEEIATAVDILSSELREAAVARSEAEDAAAAAQQTADELTVQRDMIIARNDEILGQVESAVAISVEPLDKVFRDIGMNPDSVLNTIRQGYSGQGGPLTPLSYSTRGDAALKQGETKANKIIITLDEMNTYRIAMEKLPLAMPVHASFRYSSGFGRRWGRAHEGIDMAAPIGTPVYATGDGVVIYAGRQGAYGNLIKIQHELGTETRFGHLSKIGVKVGQRVSQGDRIGAIGNTGRSTGPHLHYEVRVKGRAIDPMTFIKAAQNVF